ncbi:MAG: phage Gp37/Gp68 family protein [Planctomycetota bacterium]
MTATSIEWTDRSWQVTAGCTKVSAGCAHCYAEPLMGRQAAMAVADRERGRHPGRKAIALRVVNQRPGTGRDGYGPKSGWNRKVVTLDHRLGDPLKWRKPARVFVNSESDLFHEDVPFEFIDRVFAVMNATHIFPPKNGDEKAKPWHTYQVLTKRPERMAEYLASRGPKRYPQGDWPIFRVRGDVFRGMGPAIMNAAGVGLWPLPNVWLGTSVEDQAAADARIPHLLNCPAAVRFLSCEPLLGPVDVSAFVSVSKLQRRDRLSYSQARREVDRHWLILGGESGPGARPCDVAWLRSLVEQGKAGGVPVFVKQLGANVVSSFDEWNDGTRTDGRLDGDVMHWQLADRKGGDPDEWPIDLRVREFPTTESSPA